MRLFISYARVDKPVCKQIIDLLDMHDVWFDQRLHIGQMWWDQITQRLNWCDGFLYLLSPDSVASEYCRRELDLAITLNKLIFPVLIHKNTNIPENIRQIQYADLTNGLDVTGAKTLLTAIFIAERTMQSSAPEMPRESHMPIPAPSQIPAPTPLTTPQTAKSIPAAYSTTTTNGSAPYVTTTTNGSTPHPPPPPYLTTPNKPDGSTLIDEAVDAFRQADYDKAARILKEVQQSGYTSRFIDVSSMLKQAEAALGRQAYEREAMREYGPISKMMREDSTRTLGCTAFRAFQMTFPDYDPENLKQIYDKVMEAQPPFDLHKAMPLLDWCRIPAGKTAIERNASRKTVQIGEFFMSRYPVTNAQFQAFIDSPDGYKSSAWWQSSPEAMRWHDDHPKPLDAPPNKENHPRTNICWYEASAFCQWLSYKTGYTVKLPTEQQWQRAAQGDTNWRYPWGSRFDATLCNTKESETHGTTPVTQYPKSASPYGVIDLLGNTWEWCANAQASDQPGSPQVDIVRIVRGGSFMSQRKRTNINFYYVLNPLYRYDSIGFRLVCETGAEFLGV